MAQTPHLGIPLYETTFPAKPVVGYRYWRLDSDGNLGAPIGGGHHWRPGLNQAECRRNQHCNIGRNCGCGLYAWSHTGGHQFCNPAYFDPATATVSGLSGEANGQTVIMGAVVLFKAVQMGNGMLRAKYGVVTALSLPPQPSERLQRRVARACELYKIEVVKPHDLHDHSLDYVANDLGQFTVPRPLDWVYDIDEDRPHNYQCAPVEILENLPSGKPRYVRRKRRVLMTGTAGDTPFSHALLDDEDFDPTEIDSMLKDLQTARIEAAAEAREQARKERKERKEQEAKEKQERRAAERSERHAKRDAEKAKRAEEGDSEGTEEKRSSRHRRHRHSRKPILNMNKLEDQSSREAEPVCGSDIEYAGNPIGKPAGKCTLPRGHDGRHRMGTDALPFMKR